VRGGDRGIAGIFPTQKQKDAFDQTNDEMVAAKRVPLSELHSRESLPQEQG
jgi:hypothetical protein